MNSFVPLLLFDCNICCLSIRCFAAVNELMSGARWLLNAGIDFLEFKASEIAAAAAIFVSDNVQTLDIHQAISCLVHVGKVKKNWKLGGDPHN